MKVFVRSCQEHPHVRAATGRTWQSRTPSTPTRWFSYSTRIQSALKEHFRTLAPTKKSLFSAQKKQLGKQVLNPITINHVFGGLKDIRLFLYEASLEDPTEGLKYRDVPISQVLPSLPSASPSSTSGSPESLLWYLITGEVPSKEEALSLASDLQERVSIPAHVTQLIDLFPSHMAPMTQFSAAMLAFSSQGVFSKKYREGIRRPVYWEYIFEDSMNVIANAPHVAARIYRNVFKGGEQVVLKNNNDLVGNFVNLLGFNDPQFMEFMRLYVLLLSDSGGDIGGYVSHLVGSTLSDPYLCYSAALNSLASPLYGNASAKFMKLLQLIESQLPPNEISSKPVLTNWAQNYIQEGNLVPGFGHSYLKGDDPRVVMFCDYARKHLPQNMKFKLATQLHQIVPDLLRKTKNTNNPQPNIASINGLILHHYGLTEETFYPVVLGLTQSIGVLSNLILSRHYELPIIYPISITSKWVTTNQTWYN